MKRKSVLRQSKSQLFYTVYASRGLTGLVLLALGVLFVAAVRDTGVEAQTSKLGRPESAAAPSPTVAVSGLVRQPLNFGLGDLQAFDCVSARRVDYRKEGYFGDFQFRGVPLKELISLAGPWKKSSGFMRPTDLAVIVRNESNLNVLFSYGELLFRSPGDVILAIDAEAVMPHQSCDMCHADRNDHPWREALNRIPVLPRIVASRDLDADRSIEGVNSIEVVELYSSGSRTYSKKQPQRPLSQAIEIRDGASVLATVRSLEPYSRHSVHALEVGDAMGYHGESRCEGAYLADVLASVKAPTGMDVGYVIVAADGYRALLSSAELFSTAQPPPILIADRCDGRILEKEGAFKLVVANDTIAERWVKSIAEIEVVRAASPDNHF